MIPIDVWVPFQTLPCLPFLLDLDVTVELVDPLGDVRVLIEEGSPSHLATLQTPGLMSQFALAGLGSLDDRCCRVVPGKLGPLEALGALGELAPGAPASPPAQGWVIDTASDPIVVVPGQLKGSVGLPGRGVGPLAPPGSELSHLAVDVGLPLANV
ncbi:MAG: hypothetical protein ACRDYC_12520, partial [Acidimicrobiales bacterium]